MAEPIVARTVEMVISEMAEAGQCLVDMQASEGAAGNLSVYLRRGAVVPAEFEERETIELPIAVPELAQCLFVVSGSGTRMRDIRKLPGACLGVLRIDDGGRTGTLSSAKARDFARITSEFNSHLAVHRAVVSELDLPFHAIVHAQPRQLTYLSHLPNYQDFDHLNRRLLRWQPEAILNFPEGIAVLPFLVPGQPALMQANEQALRRHRLVVWAKHGVMAHSSKSVMSAVDLIEYAETAASYELMDRMLGGQAEGLSTEELRAVAAAYLVPQRLF